MFYLKTAFALVFVLMSSVGFAGGITSSGTGEVLQDFNPWFLEPEGEIIPIKYCIQHNPKTFSMSRDEVEGLVNLAIHHWYQTYDKLNIAPIELKRNRYFSISYHFDNKSVCDETTELKFKFGVVDEDVAETLKLHPALTLAFAKPQYDQKKQYNNDGRGKGYLFVVPDLTDDNRLESSAHGKKKWLDGQLLAALIHEMGHILGFPHVPNTVMSEGWGTRIFEIGHLGDHGGDFLNYSYQQEACKLGLFNILTGGDAKVLEDITKGQCYETMPSFVRFPGIVLKGSEKPPQAPKGSFTEFLYKLKDNGAVNTDRPWESFDQKTVKLRLSKKGIAHGLQMAFQSAGEFEVVKFKTEANLNLEIGKRAEPSRDVSFVKGIFPLDPSLIDSDLPFRPHDDKGEDKLLKTRSWETPQKDVMILLEKGFYVKVKQDVNRNTDVLTVRRNGIDYQIHEFFKVGIEDTPTWRGHLEFRGRDIQATLRLEADFDLNLSYVEEGKMHELTFAAEAFFYDMSFFAAEYFTSGIPGEPKVRSSDRFNFFHCYECEAEEE